MVGGQSHGLTMWKIVWRNARVCETYEADQEIEILAQ